MTARSGMRRTFFNPFTDTDTGSYSATSNNMKLVHWPLMGGLIRLVQRGGAWAGWRSAQSPPCCTKRNMQPTHLFTASVPITGGGAVGEAAPCPPPSREPELHCILLLHNFTVHRTRNCN